MQHICLYVCVYNLFVLRYPNKKWVKLGTFHARDERMVQSFPLDEHLFAKYIKVSETDWDCVRWVWGQWSLCSSSQLFLSLFFPWCIRYSPNTLRLALLSLLWVDECFEWSGVWTHFRSLSSVIWHLKALFSKDCNAIPWFIVAGQHL